MSGTLRFSVNNIWNPSIRAGADASVFFLWWLQFVNAHTGLDWIGYGTGKTQSGTTPPAAWTGWDPVVDSIPWGDNSWVVFQATNADPLLDGGGSKPWQCKIQVTQSAGFDDCNVADIDYGQEGETNCVCMRFSAEAGWSAVTLDFAPSGGEDASNNRKAFSTLNQYVYFDVCGDDDTIVWRGSAVTSPAADKYENVRGGYMGMLQRRSSVIENPFFSAVGYIRASGASSGSSAIIGKRDTLDYYQFRASPASIVNMPWPTYSLWRDGTKVSTHRGDHWDKNCLIYITPSRATGEDIVPAMLVAQWQPPNQYAIIGEYRFLGATAFDYAPGTVFGDGDPRWIQIAYESLTYGGIAMPWPVGTIPAW